MMSLSCSSGHLMIEPFRLAVSLTQMGKVQFLAEQKSGSAAGTNTRLLPTAVSASTLHPSGRRCNGALRFAALQSHVKGGFAAKPCWRVKQY